MQSPRAAVALTLIGVVLAVLMASGAGCGGSCSDCPPTSVLVSSSANVDLMLTAPGLTWSGPACPPYPPACRGDGVNTFCTYIIVTGRAAGECALTLWFSDRPVQVVHAQFGSQSAAHACCGGFPVVGETTFTVPTTADAGIYGSDGATDAVTFLPPDGGATGDAAPDAAPSPDGGTEAD